MSPARPGALLSVTAMLAALSSRPAAAADTSPPEVVMIIGADREDTAVPVADAVEAHLSDLSVAFRVERLPAILPATLPEQIAAAERARGTEGAACVFWFDLAEDGAVYVHLRGGADAGDRLLVRRLEPGSEEDRGRAEELAIIVRSSVAGLLAGGRIGILVDEIPEASPPEPPPPEPPPPDGESASEERTPEFLDILLGYALAVRGETHPAQHGLWLGLGLLATPGLRVEAGYAVLAPLSARGELASLRLHRHPVRVGLGYGLRLGPARVGIGAHLVIEHARQHVEGLAPGMRASADLDDVTLALSPHLSADLAVWNRLGLFLRAGVDLPLTPLDYAATRGERTEVLISAWPVQPFVLAGLRVVPW